MICLHMIETRFQRMSSQQIDERLKGLRCHRHMKHFRDRKDGVPYDTDRIRRPVGFVKMAQIGMDAATLKVKNAASGYQMRELAKEGNRVLQVIDYPSFGRIQINAITPSSDHRAELFLHTLSIDVVHLTSGSVPQEITHRNPSRCSYCIRCARHSSVQHFKGPALAGNRLAPQLSRMGMTT